MLESQKDSLLVPSLSHNVRQSLILVLQVHLLEVAKPEDEASAHHAHLATLHDRKKELVLVLSALDKVSPAAQVMSQVHVLLATGQSLQDFGGFKLSSKVFSTCQVQRSPEIEEFLAPLLVDIAVNERVPLRVLVDDVEGISVPGAEAATHSVLVVVNHDALQSVQFLFKLLHLFGCAMNFLEGLLALLPHVLVQDLEQQFRDKETNVLFVLVGDLDTFTVHGVHIRFILVTQLVHPLDQVVPLLGQLCQLFVHQRLLLSSSNFLHSESFELLSEVSQATRI